jgi:hypothetical protein
MGTLGTQKTSRIGAKKMISRLINLKGKFRVRPRTKIRTTTRLARSTIHMAERRLEWSEYVNTALIYRVVLTR